MRAKQRIAELNRQTRDLLCEPGVEKIVIRVIQGRKPPRGISYRRQPSFWNCEDALFQCIPAQFRSDTAAGSELHVDISIWYMISSSYQSGNTIMGHAYSGASHELYVSDGTTWFFQEEARMTPSQHDP